MGQRYYAALLAVAANSQPPLSVIAPPPPPPFRFAAGASAFPASMPYASLVFSHRVTQYSTNTPPSIDRSEYFQDSGASALYSPTTYNAAAPHKFSIMYNLSQYARYDGQFEFYYVWDVRDGSSPINADGNNFQHWIQSNNPLTSFNDAGAYTPIVQNSAGGYSLFVGLAMDAKFPNNPWGGSAYIHDSGSPQDSEFFAIGMSGYLKYEQNYFNVRPRRGMTRPAP